MIHEISPKKLFNQYENHTASKMDNVLVFSGDNVVIFSDNMEVLSSSDEKPLSLPKVSDIEGHSTEDFQYLFRIDKEKYFLFKGKTPASLEKYLKHVKQIRQRRDKYICLAIATGYHLYVWYRDNKYCGRCGSLLNHSDKERMLECPKCGNQIYPRISPAVIVGVTNGNKLLMTKYADRVYKRYALVAGFTEIGESPEETVAREVMEEVGLKVKNIRYFKSQPWGTDSNLLLGYFCDLEGSDKIRLDYSELSVGHWFEREDIPVEDDDISLTLNMVQAFKEGREI